MFVGGRTVRIIVFGAPYWVLPILGNYQRFQHDVEINCAQILYSPCRIQPQYTPDYDIVVSIFLSVIPI